MLLMTKEIEEALNKHPIGSQDGKGMNAKVLVKFFGGSAATWLITEGEPRPNGDWLLYGFVTLGLPDEFESGKLLWEWGYVTLNQLKGVRFPPFGLPIERDISVKPGKSKVKDLACMVPAWMRGD
jgi:hypothetical protein